MKNIYYWSPCLTSVGTYRSTINSAISLIKFSKNEFSVKIINVCGEWNKEKNFFKRNGIDVIDLGLNYFDILPKTGFIKSRISNIIIILLSIIPLIKFLYKYKIDFLIIHLITSLPLVLIKIFNLKIKIFLRISGYPKLTLFRKTLWKHTSEKIFKITCPSNDLLKQLRNKKIFDDKKLRFLPDPIIRIEQFLKQKKLYYEKNITRKYFISVGRLTKQKNFEYLINEYSKFISNNHEIDLYIFGEGEQKDYLQKKINNLSLENRVFLKGYNKNIFFHMRNAQAFILSSLWEDPGFVMIEAALSNLFIISSDCKNGPSEFLNHGENGILYKSNSENQLNISLNKFLKINDKELFEKKIKAKKRCKTYTIFNHNKILTKLLKVD
jgi:glycosyltransferase involved in cell wall biosynthesis